MRQLEMLRAREISVTELAEAHIRADRAAESEAECVRGLRCGAGASAGAGDGCGAGDARGPLHGLPVTVKSSIATAGYQCEIGSLIHKGEIPREDAVVVARLRAAGALILGTTNCPEFLMAYETDNLLHGRTRNPWDLERTPGGSSGGESAAIAAGMSAAGLGSGQRRIGARAGAFHRDLFAEADAGTHSGTRTSAALRGAVFDAGRDWANGADDGGCGVDVSHAERAGSDAIRRARLWHCAT